MSNVMIRGLMKAHKANRDDLQTMLGLKMSKHVNLHIFVIVLIAVYKLSHLLKVKKSMVLIRIADVLTLSNLSHSYLATNHSIII